jgi:hypothetical protein
MSQGDYQALTQQALPRAGAIILSLKLFVLEGTLSELNDRLIR